MGRALCQSQRALHTQLGVCLGCFCGISIPGRADFFLIKVRKAHGGVERWRTETREERAMQHGVRSKKFNALKQQYWTEISVKPIPWLRHLHLQQGLERGG